MSRINYSAKWVTISAFVFLTASGLFGAVLLEDGFTDPVFSHGKWLASDDLAATVSGGACALNNTKGIGEYLHTFGSPKPSTFTITYTLKSVTGDANRAGVLFCKQPNTYNGYFLTVEGDELVLYNMVQSGNDIGWNPINNKGKQSIDINPSNNEITVSKSGSRIVLFANGAYVGEYNDNTYGSGDFALFLSDNTSAVFGPVRITDTFTDGGARTSFADNFDNGRSKYWKYLSVGGNPEISDANGALKIKTDTKVSSWTYVDLGLADFTARVDVQHLNGGTTINNMYGIVLLGSPPNGGGEIPMVYFAITGNRRYAVWKTGTTMPDPAQSTAINGSAGDLGVAHIDTLEVKKASGSSKYEFIVNGQTLSADYPIADFPITGIGIFTFPEITIAFDNFEAKKEGTTSIKFVRNPNQSLRGGAAAKNVNNVFYDLRGRKRYVSNPQAAARTLRASGVYVNQSGREVLTDRNKRTR